MTCSNVYDYNFDYNITTLYMVVFLKTQCDSSYVYHENHRLLARGPDFCCTWLILETEQTIAVLSNTT